MLAKQTELWEMLVTATKNAILSCEIQATLWEDYIDELKQSGKELTDGDLDDLHSQLWVKAEEENSIRQEK